MSVLLAKAQSVPVRQEGHPSAPIYLSARFTSQGSGPYPGMPPPGMHVPRVAMNVGTRNACGTLVPVPLSALGPRAGHRPLRHAACGAGAEEQGRVERFRRRPLRARRRAIHTPVRAARMGPRAPRRFDLRRVRRAGSRDPSSLPRLARGRVSGAAGWERERECA